MEKKGSVSGAAWLLAIMAWNALWVHACIPNRPSPECQAQISACLKQCPEQEPAESPAGAEGRGLDLADIRSNCEKRCHERCR